MCQRYCLSMLTFNCRRSIASACQALHSFDQMCLPQARLRLVFRLSDLVHLNGAVYAIGVPARSFSFFRRARRLTLLCCRKVDIATGCSAILSGEASNTLVLVAELETGGWEVEPKVGGFAFKIAFKGPGLRPRKPGVFQVFLCFLYGFRKKYDYYGRL